MQPLRIKDNTQTPKEKFSDIAKLVHKIADKTLEQLEREGIFVFPEILAETNALDREQMVLQSVNDTYRSCNVMGFLGYGGERLVIGSRFCHSGEDYFLQYLLEKAIGLPDIVHLETDADGENRLFHFLIFLFPRYLRQAMRKGLFKTYIRNSYNDPDVRGSVDVARHIRQNTPFVGNIAYNCREFSYDNSLTELVRHTVEYIKGEPFGSRILPDVRDEVKLIVNATPHYAPCNRQKVIAENQNFAVRHAYFKEYLALQRLCLLILRHQKHQIGSGSRQIYGILFDGAWLWEEYLDSVLNRGGRYFYHPRNRRGEDRQYLFGGPSGLIYPDFISTNAASRTIADAKYKPGGNIGNQDYLQVLAYMYRFDAKTGYYLYPEASGGDDRVLHMNRGSTFEHDVAPREDIVLIKHGLRIPSDAASYGDFVAEIRQNEEEFLLPFRKEGSENETN